MKVGRAPNIYIHASLRSRSLHLATMLADLSIADRSRDGQREMSQGMSDGKDRAAHDQAQSSIP
jgi:hypothetical protein